MVLKGVVVIFEFNKEEIDHLMSRCPSRFSTNHNHIYNNEEAKKQAVIDILHGGLGELRLPSPIVRFINYVSILVVKIVSNACAHWPSTTSGKPVYNLSSIMLGI